MSRAGPWAIWSLSWGTVHLSKGQRNMVMGSPVPEPLAVSVCWLYQHTSSSLQTLASTTQFPYLYSRHNPNRVHLLCGCEE